MSDAPEKPQATRPVAGPPPPPAAAPPTGGGASAPPAPKAAATAPAKTPTGVPAATVRPKAPAGKAGSGGRKHTRRPPAPSRPYKFRLLPITIFAVVLMLGARVGDLWRIAAHSPELPDIPATLAQNAQPSTGDKPTDKPADKPADKAAEKPATDAKPAEALGPIGDQELLKHYADRRAELDRRTKELEMREALLSAAEKRIDEKVKEMERARTEIQGMMKLGEEKKSAEIENLIGIYDKMKPKEAALIFEQMDMPQLLAILPKMKDTKTALILAAMNPSKAKEVTAALLERKAAPTPGTGAGTPAAP